MSAICAGTIPSAQKIGWPIYLRDTPTAKFRIKRGSTVLVTYTYDLDGNRLTKELENCTIATSTYDDKGQLTLLAHEKNGATQAAFGYTYNSVGNRTSKVVNMQSVVRTETTTYDAIDQVTGVNYGNSRSESFLYDAMGNRVSSTDSATGTTTYTTNAKNQYLTATKPSGGGGTTTFAYDPLGNLAGDGIWTYTYDSKNRLLTAVSTAQGVNLTQTYDADNKVVSRTLNGTTRYFIYDGWSLIAEYNSTGDLVKRYVHGAGIDEILVQTQGSTDAFYHHDALGSTVLLTNASGNIVRSYEYDVFGQVSNPPSVDDMFSADPYANRFLYNGREFLKEANLYDYRNRVYSAELGRFLQTDPIRFEAGDGNLYRYVGNLSSLLIDPMGLYVTYTGGGSQAFWDNYRKQYDELCKTKTGKRQIEEMENSDQEYVIGPSQPGQRNWSVANKIFLTENFKFDTFSHEIQHAMTHVTGNPDRIAPVSHPVDQRDFGKYDTSGPAEREAMRMQNIVKREHMFATDNAENAARYPGIKSYAYDGGRTISVPYPFGR